MQSSEISGPHEHDLLQTEPDLLQTMFARAIALTAHFSVKKEVTCSR